MARIRRHGVGWRWLLSSGIVTLFVGCGQDPVVVESDEPRDPVEVQAMVDRAVATTGDLITYRIRVDAEAGYEVEIPEAGAEIAGFRIVDVGQEEPVEKGGRVQRERWYQLRADLVGSYVLPPVEIGYRRAPAADGETDPWQTQVTSEIFVEVESVLPADGEASDIRALKPLREVRPATPWILIVSLVFGVGLAAAALIWYLRHRASQRGLPPPIPAHVLAFEALDRLRQTDFDDEEAVRRFYFQISEVVRAYVEGRFRLNATDLTTEEILQSVTTLEELAADQNQELQRFLVDTDQVKFAHRDPTRGDIEGTYEQALGFVEATRPVPATVEEEQAA